MKKKSIIIRLTEEQKEKITEKAKKEGLSISAYCRMKILK